MGVFLTVTSLKPISTKTIILFHSHSVEFTSASRTLSSQ